MPNPNFNPTFSSNDIWRDQDATRCLTDDLNTIEADISALDEGKAESDHTHNYAPANEDATHPGCYYRTVNSATEWINPPLIAGTEYRTTERWNGKVVYTVLTSIGAIADASSVDIREYGATRIVRYAGWVDTYALPYINADNLTASYSVYFSVRTTTIDVNCGTAMVGRQGYVQLWYTKD